MTIVAVLQNCRAHCLPCSSAEMRQVIGWSMSSRIDKELMMNALLMAVWRRKPTTEVLVHSDQGSQFSSYDWRDFLKATAQTC